MEILTKILNPYNSSSSCDQALLLNLMPDELYVNNGAKLDPGPLLLGHSSWGYAYSWYPLADHPAKFCSSDQMRGTVSDADILMMWLPPLGGGK